MKKRMLSLILSFFMVLFIPYVESKAAAADDWKKEGNYYYTETSEGTVLLGFVQPVSGDVILPDTLGGKTEYYLGDGVFENCDAKSVTLSKGVVGFYLFAFDKAYTIENIYVDKQNSKFSDIDGVLFNYDKTVLRAYPKARAGAYHVPEGTTAIESMSFQGSRKLTKLTMADSVETLDGPCFGDCPMLKEVILSKKLTFLGSGAFRNNEAIESIVIPGSVETIAYEAFMRCPKLKTVVIEEGVSYISVNMFSHCSALESVTLPSTIKTIRRYAFSDCPSLKSINLPEGLTEIEYNAFDACTALKTVSIPSTLKTVGQNTFYQCSALETLNFANGLEQIPNCMFQGCSSLKSVTFPKSVRVIHERAFKDCSSLENVVFSENTNTVGEYSFQNCTSLKTVTFLGISDLPYIAVQERAFYGCFNIKYAFAANLEPNKLISIQTGNDFLKNAVWHYKMDDHSYQWKIDKEANCYEEGKKHEYCTVEGCAAVRNENTPVSIEHTGEIIISQKGYAATCTKEGKTDETKYNCCGNIAQKATIIPKKAHKFGGYKTTTKATTSKNGVQSRTCTVCKKATDTKVIAKISSVKFSDTTKTYTGKNIAPSVTVKDSSGKTLKNGTDYTVENKKSVGKYTIKVTFKGNYSGTKSTVFTINPVKTSVKSVKAGSKRFTLSWSKKTSEVTGYEIMYSTSSSFKSGNKTKIVNSNKTTSLTIKSLKAKKKYYVKVRTYKTVSGKKYYSGWTSAKSVTTKK